MEGLGKLRQVEASKHPVNAGPRCALLFTVFQVALLRRRLERQAVMSGLAVSSWLRITFCLARSWCGHGCHFVCAALAKRRMCLPRQQQGWDSFLAGQEDALDLEAAPAMARLEHVPRGFTLGTCRICRQDSAKCLYWFMLMLRLGFGCTRALCRLVGASMLEASRMPFFAQGAFLPSKFHLRPGRLLEGCSEAHQTCLGISSCG